MIVTMIITFLLFIFILLTYNFYVHYGQNGRFINRIPGPSGYPIIGNLLYFTHLYKDLFKFLISLNQNYSIFKLWLFFTPIVAIRHPDDIEVILRSTTHIEKSFLYKPFQNAVNTGLFTSGGTKWRSRRKILTPTFHFAVLQQFADTIIKKGENMAKCLKNMEDTVVEDLTSFVSEHILNAFCETVIGTSQGLPSLQIPFEDIIQQGTEIMMYRVMRLWLYNDWIFSLTSKGRHQKMLIKMMNAFTQKLISERKLYHERTNGRYLKTSDKTDKTDKNTLAEKDDSETITIKKKRLAMMDMLIAASRENYLTDSDIQEEINTIMIAGTDTTSMTMSYVLLLLAEHKDVQDRVRVEINAAIHKDGGKLIMQSLHNLSYLERCIKETLRLYPVAYVISRITSKDVKLQSYLVPAGTALLINIHGVHRDPNYWPNPEIFDPDRFLPENIQNQHPYSYLPFSAGPRNCIGQRFCFVATEGYVSSSDIQFLFGARRVFKGHSA
ncbi:cytochrome P450 4C1-like [Pogonomyrmex barbatus]|uniref:Cytochrome P450 4C1-like n=1 Tax=Pogonomyrmex barbatus TaxID=144034 RepID=A0A8N1S3V0_9HYME|nr:cytochrome P450 4C1-like [Pogonomyrmex barbatus]